MMPILEMVKLSIQEGVADPRLEPGSSSLRQGIPCVPEASEPPGGHSSSDPTGTLAAAPLGSFDPAHQLVQSIQPGGPLSPPLPVFQHIPSSLPGWLGPLFFLPNTVTV